VKHIEELRRKRSGLVLALAIVVITAAGCATRFSRSGKQSDIKNEAPPFTPTTYIAKPQVADGSKYPDLMSGASYMIWVCDDVVKLKMAQDANMGVSVGKTDDRADQLTDIQRVNANFLVFELHIKSSFSDPSIAKDFTRNLELFMADDSGRPVSPLQMYISKPTEVRVGVGREFSRTILVLFPRYDIITGNPTINESSPGIRVYAEGYDTTYMFEWLPADTSQQNIPDRSAEFRNVVQMGFGEFQSVLDAVFRNFK